MAVGREMPMERGRDPGGEQKDESGNHNPDHRPGAARLGRLADRWLELDLGLDSRRFDRHLSFNPWVRGRARDLSHDQHCTSNRRNRQ